MLNTQYDMPLFKIDDELYKYYLEPDKKQSLTFKKITKKDLLDITHCNFKNSDILQEGIGDCYLLAALGAIIDRNPDLLKETIKWNNETKKVEVYFYDDNKNRCCYILDPTIVIKNHKTNKHKAWISIIEKAYAIHRMIFQKDKLTENEHDKYIQIENKFMLTEEEKKIKIKYNESSFYMESLTGGCGFNVFQHILNCQIHFQRIDDFETNLKDAEDFLTAMNFINSEFVIKNILNKKIIWNNSLRILKTIFNCSLHDNTGYQVLKVMNINLIKHTKKNR